MSQATTYHVLAIRKNGSAQYTKVRIPDDKLTDLVERYYQQGFERVRLMDESTLKESAKSLIAMGLLSPLAALQSPEAIMRGVSALVK